VITINNSSVSLSLTLTKFEKVEYYIRINTHQLIVMRFWVKSDVNTLYDWTQVSLVLHLSSETPSIDLTITLKD